MTAITLQDRDGRFKRVLVDAGDTHLLHEHSWHIDRDGYVCRSTGGKTVFLHRQIIRPADGEMVDHINGDRLDNCRANLRPCSVLQNTRNQRLRVTNTSGFKGVHWNAHSGKWQASIRNGERKVYLGTFADPRVAAHAYNRAAIRLHGEFARLNPL